jgi:predicted nicotinamide N-methyase
VIALPAISGNAIVLLDGFTLTDIIRDASLGFLIYFDRAMRSSPPVGTVSISGLMKSTQVRRLRVLELGAGCGIVGVAFAQLVKCDMLLTDLEEAQEILGSNVRCASPMAGSTVQAQNLDWETGLDDSSNTNFDLILVSDCIYNPESSVHLVKTLRQLALRAPNVLILVGFKRRHEADTIFFERMQFTKFETVESINIPLPHTNTDQDPEPPTAEFYTFRPSTGTS